LQVSSTDSRKLRASRIALAHSELYHSRRPSRIFRQGEKVELYNVAAEMIGNRAITYLEFGVFQGRSIKRIAERFPHPDARFIGFDSFEGLPEHWGGIRGLGHFSVDGAIPSVTDERISFVKGWFQDTLPDFLASHPPLTGPVLVHYDADLYSATLFLLTTLWHHCPNYYFLCDEFYSDEAVAMHDFSLAYPVEIDFLASTVDEERPLQTFGQLKNISYQQVADTLKQAG
jgi:O-methyltransferase